MTAKVHTDRPQVAVCPMLTDRSISATGAARALVERGFSGMFVAEHTHIPVRSTVSAHADAPAVPELYRRLLDPYVALAFAAATTELDIGTCVSLVGEHDPIVLAKTIATLDRLSEGRLTLGIGFGWNLAEFEDHGLPASRRVSIVREKIALMKQFWTQDVVVAEGEFVELAPSWGGPRPATSPHPPILLGASASPSNQRSIASWADGWIAPIDALLADGLPSTITDFRRSWESMGRDPAGFHVMGLHRGSQLESLPIAVTRAARLGVQRVVLTVMEEDEDRFLAVLDRATALLERL